MGKVTVAGLMTGNSLDAFDLAAFEVEGSTESPVSVRQVLFVSEPYPENLKAHALRLRAVIAENDGVVPTEHLSSVSKFTQDFTAVASTLIQSAASQLKERNAPPFVLCGVHGQTLGHKPPSIAAGSMPYTIQALNGGALSDSTGLPIIADFRSDDVLAGGEGAPFAPMYQLFLATLLGHKDTVMINAGNTSNLAVIHTETQQVVGWDCGPCNHLPDYLMRTQAGVACDIDGKIAQGGRVVPELLNVLWEEGVVRSDGCNALELPPPRSFDPQWYKVPTQLESAESYSFQDRVRTATAFSAYCVAHSIAHAVANGHAIGSLVLFGGGWKNPVLVQELRDLIGGRASYVLEKHSKDFEKLATVAQALPARLSDEIGLPSSGMEAGIFAYAALRRIFDAPFSLPSVTNCSTPTVCGAVFTPHAHPMTVLGQTLIDERTRFKAPDLSRAALANR